MTTQRIEFPELREPTILDPPTSEGVIATYSRYVDGEFERKGGAALRALFHKVIQELAQMQSVPLHSRALAWVLPGPCTQMREKLKNLRTVVGDFIPLQELEADFGFLIAETGDVAVRLLRGGQLVTQLDGGPAEITSQTIGITSFRDVLGMFDLVRMKYAECAVSVAEISEHAGAQDRQRALFANVEHFIVKHVRATNRMFLLMLALWLEAQAQIKLKVATASEVLPHLGEYPQARDLVRDATLLKSTFALVEYLMKQEFNRPQGVMEFFVNIGNLAQTLGEYTVSRTCFTRAKRYLEGASPQPGFVRAMQLLEELDPQSKA